MSTALHRIEGWGARGVPEGGACVYYLFQRALPEEVQARFVASFSDDERTRHTRFLRDGDQNLFLLAHGMLRCVLANHLGVSPGELAFESGEHGRPELTHPTGAEKLRFNLTHTKGLAACALAPGRAVGVDAENLSRSIDRRSVAARVFSAPERQSIEERSGASAQERFFLHWTLKESYIKAVGKGFALPLRQITTLPADDASATLRLADIEDDASRWILRTHRAGSEHLLAVALDAGADAPVSFEELSLD
jgi:4'-phosphopantetheinyl transferase